VVNIIAQLPVSNNIAELPGLGLLNNSSTGPDGGKVQLNLMNMSFTYGYLLLTQTLQFWIHASSRYKQHTTSIALSTTLILVLDSGMVNTVIRLIENEKNYCYCYYGNFL